jgi:hypothetical protein
MTAQNHFCAKEFTFTDVSQFFQSVFMHLLNPDLDPG